MIPADQVNYTFCLFYRHIERLHSKLVTCRHLDAGLAHWANMISLRVLVDFSNAFDFAES